MHYIRIRTFWLYVVGLTFIALLFSNGVLSAQEEPAFSRASAPETEVFQPHHSLALLLGHTHVREGVVEGGNKWLTLPAWALEYNFVFHPRWAIGLHTDIIIEEFVVERHLKGDNEGEVIERSFPVAPALMATYKPGHHWGILLGAGMEFASGESFFLNRLGGEYSVEVTNNWELLLVAQYDFRYNAYDTWMLGIGVARVLGRPAKE